MNRTRRDRVALAAVVFAVLLAQVLLYPGIPELVAALGATTTLDAGTWFLAAEFGAFVAFAGVWGAVSDRTGRRVPYVAAGALGGAVGYLALAVLPGLPAVSFAHVLALRVAQGAATVGAFSLAMTMLMDLPGGHGTNMGAAGVAIGLGTAIGAPLGGQLTEVHALAPLYVAAGLLLLAALVATRVADRAPDPDRGRLRALAAGLRRYPEVAVPYAFGFVDRFTAGFFALVGTLYFRQSLGVDAGTAGLLLALFFVPFGLLQYPMGALSDRVGRVLPIAAGSALYGVAVAAVGLTSLVRRGSWIWEQLTAVGLAPSVALAGAAMACVGVLGALMAPATMALVTDLAPDGERGTAMAGFNVAGSLGFLAGVVGGGLVADRAGYLAAFLVAGGTEFALAVLALPALLRLSTSQRVVGGT